MIEYQVANQELGLVNWVLFTLKEATSSSPSNREGFKKVDLSTFRRVGGFWTFPSWILKLLRLFAWYCNLSIMSSIQFSYT